MAHAGFTAADLMDAGFTAAHLAGAGYSAADLTATGYDALQFTSAAKELRRAGYTEASWELADYSDSTFGDDGFQMQACEHQSLQALLTRIPRRCSVRRRVASAAQRQKPLELESCSFTGTWLTSTGEEERVPMPGFQAKDSATCELVLEGKTYTGSLQPDGTIAWRDGDIWKRHVAKAALPHASPQAQAYKLMKAEETALRLERRERQACRPRKCNRVHYRKAYAKSSSWEEVGDQAG